MFRHSPKENTPTFFSETFRRGWCALIERRRTFIGEQKKEMVELNRSLPAVIKAYWLAISAATALTEFENGPNQKWTVISLLLNLAEILSSGGDQHKADQLLKKTAEKAEELYKVVADNSISFKSARILVLIGLYFDDIAMAGTYMNFLHEVQRQKVDSLNSTDLLLFKKIFAETKKAVNNRVQFKRENLFGFHMKN